MADGTTWCALLLQNLEHLVGIVLVRRNGGERAVGFSTRQTGPRCLDDHHHELDEAQE